MGGHQNLWVSQEDTWAKVRRPGSQVADKPWACGWCEPSAWQCRKKSGLQGTRVQEPVRTIPLPRTPEQLQGTVHMNWAFQGRADSYFAAKEILPETSSTAALGPGLCGFPLLPRACSLYLRLLGLWVFFPTTLFAKESEMDNHFPTQRWGPHAHGVPFPGDKLVSFNVWVLKDPETRNYKSHV